MYYYSFSKFLSIFDNFDKMYKVKTEPSLEKVSQKQEQRSKDFKQKAAHLLTRIQAVHNEVEDKKLNKLQRFLSDITNMEQSINEEIKEKKSMFEQLLLQINRLNQELQQQSHASQKIEMQIRNRIQLFSKNNEKALERIKAGRVQTQQRIQIYLNEKLQALCKKNLLYKIPQATFNQFKDQLSNIKNQVVNFFEEAEAWEEKTRKQIFSAIEQCGNMINDKQIQNAQNDALQYMRVIQAEIETRVYALTQQRQSMEEEVIRLLEKVQQATSVI